MSEAVAGDLINVKSKKKFLCSVEQLVHLCYTITSNFSVVDPSFEKLSYYRNIT
jgi:hypothetical protein